MDWVDDYIRAFPRLSCKALSRLIRKQRPGAAAASLKIDLEEYVWARRGEIEEVVYGTSNTRN
jgi:hypothetical protein